MATLRQRKSENLTFRVSPDDKELLERAAAGTDSDVTTFVLGPALERAREMLAQTDFTLITELDRQRFIELVESPPPPSESMLRHFRDDRHKLVE